MSPFVKLLWFHQCDPETAAAVRWWVGLKDYVLWHLTGELVTERSSASATGLLNLATGDWDAEVVALTGARLEQLPPVRSPTEMIARVAPLGGADGPLGNLGSGALAPGVAGLSLGTSGALRMVIGAPPANPDPALFCYALTDDLWVAGGAVSNGGIVVSWAADAFAIAGIEAVLELAASVPAGSEGLVMLPYVLAERAPAGTRIFPAPTSACAAATAAPTWRARRSRARRSSSRRSSTGSS